MQLTGHYLITGIDIGLYSLYTAQTAELSGLYGDIGQHGTGNSNG